MLSVAPFVSYVKVSSALKSLEDVSKKLNDQTNISQLMALTTKHYSHSIDAAVDAIIELVDSLRSGLIFKDITKDAHINKEFLFGGKHKV